MTKPSSLISLRINEEDLLLLDARIGQDGARNRSDVVRLAIQEFLRGQPLLPDMSMIKIPLGRRDQMNLQLLYELEGTNPEQAALEGLKLYIQQCIDRRVQTDMLQEALDKSRAYTVKNEDYQQ